MKVFRFKFDTSGRPTWTHRLSHIFGERNTGFLLAGDSADAAYAEWAGAQAPGEVINRGYVIITEQEPKK